MNPRPVARAALLVAATLALAGCGGGSSSSPAAGSSGPSGSSASSSASGGSSTTATPDDNASSQDPVVKVQGVPLTPQGTKLPLGKTASVSWHPSKTTTGVARLTVTKLQTVPIATFKDWQLDTATQRSTPYFVHATVRNMGKGPLSGVPVPLYLLDGHHTLLQASTFRAPFPACPSTPLPPAFTHGKKATVCLVYFAPDHGKLAAVSFRPAQAFDAITWTGPVAKP